MAGRRLGGTLTDEYESRLLAVAQGLGERARRAEPLARYSALGVGGPADLLVIAESPATLVAAVGAARAVGLPWRVLGGLTNLLVPDEGLRGLVILNRARAVSWEPDYRLPVEAGASIAPLAREAVRRGWGGLTWAVGLPGTVGGAVVNNAGAFGGEIAAMVSAAEVLAPTGEVLTVTPQWFDFRYRCSRLKGAGMAWVVLKVIFQLRPGDPEQLAAKAAEYTERRQRTQPPGRTLGSTFKNPPGDYAGRLIEAAGLKGTRVGGIIVSAQHANFFLNEGGGTAADFLTLLRQVQATVEQQFGVRLEPEIEIVGGNPWVTS